VDSPWAELPVASAGVTFADATDADDDHSEVVNQSEIIVADAASGR